MPHYDYQHTDENSECSQGHLFEYFQSMKDETLKVCPTCNRNVTRLISSGTGLIFKGPGWYRDLYGLKPQTPKLDNS